MQRKNGGAGPSKTEGDKGPEGEVEHPAKGRETYQGVARAPKEVFGPWMIVDRRTRGKGGPKGKQGITSHVTNSVHDKHANHASGSHFGGAREFVRKDG